MVKTLPSNAGDAGSIPGGGGKIPCALWPKNPPKNVKQKQYCNKFSTDLLKMVQIKKKKKTLKKKSKVQFLLFYILAGSYILLPHWKTICLF